MQLYIDRAITRFFFTLQWACRSEFLTDRVAQSCDLRLIRSQSSELIITSTISTLSESVKQTTQGSTDFGPQASYVFLTNRGSECFSERRPETISFAFSTPCLMSEEGTSLSIHNIAHLEGKFCLSVAHCESRVTCPDRAGGSSESVDEHWISLSEPHDRHCSSHVHHCTNLRSQSDWSIESYQLLHSAKRLFKPTLQASSAIH
jgi:hypothetical protein